jgi:hypothetical protein
MTFLTCIAKVILQTHLKRRNFLADWTNLRMMRYAQLLCRHSQQQNEVEILFDGIASLVVNSSVMNGTLCEYRANVSRLWT